KKGEPVGQPFLADAMARMFPPEDTASPNKLRVDLLMRAYQDATAVSVSGAVLAPAEASTDDGAQRTAALPGSRKLKVERRRIAILGAELRAGEEEAFAQAVESAAGISFPTGDLRFAVFGHAAGVERGVAHAARAALELRQMLRLAGSDRA